MRKFRPLVMIGSARSAKHSAADRTALDYDKSRFVIIDPHGGRATRPSTRRALQSSRASTKRITARMLVAAAHAGGARAFASPVGRHLLGRHHAMCREIGALYIDPWWSPARLLFRQDDRSRKALQLRAAGNPCWRPSATAPAATTAVSTCGRQSRHGSWFVSRRC